MTDKEIADILSDMIVIVDSREKKNNHILEMFNEMGIKYIKQKVDSADYTFVLPNYQHLNLDGIVLVERKFSLDEIIGNFTTNRERFVREFERMSPDSVRHIIIETATWTKLLRGSYRSQVSPKSLMASIMTWNVRYNCHFWFAGTNESPTIIYNLLQYGLREKLKQFD